MPVLGIDVGTGGPVRPRVEAVRCCLRNGEHAHSPRPKPRGRNRNQPTGAGIAGNDSRRLAFTGTDPGRFAGGA